MDSRKAARGMQTSPWSLQWWELTRMLVVLHAGVKGDVQCFRGSHFWQRYQFKDNKETFTLQTQPERRFPSVTTSSTAVAHLHCPRYPSSALWFWFPWLWHRPAASALWREAQSRAKQAPSPPQQHASRSSPALVPAWDICAQASRLKMRRAIPVADFGASQSLCALWAVKYINSQALHEPHSSVQYHMAFGFVCPVHLSHVFPIIAYRRRVFSCLPLEETCCCSFFLDEAMAIHIIFIGVFYCPYFFTAHATGLPGPLHSLPGRCLLLPLC